VGSAVTGWWNRLSFRFSAELPGEHLIDLADAQGRAEAWCRDVAGTRIHGTIQARLAEVFAEHEAGALLLRPARIT
jgi:hypothetical protein